MQQKILKTGNSLAVTIPSGLAKIYGLKPGHNVTVQEDLAKGKLTIFFESSGQLSLLSKRGGSNS